MCLWHDLDKKRILDAFSSYFSGFSGSRGFEKGVVGEHPSYRRSPLHIHARLQARGQAVRLRNVIAQRSRK